MPLESEAALWRIEQAESGDADDWRDRAAACTALQSLYTSEMDEISQQLLYQRLRNRVIELLELYSSLDDLAKFGVFSAINMVEDWQPLDYELASTVFSQKEKDSVGEFMKHWDLAADVTGEDIWNIAELESSPEWVRLSRTAKKAFLAFSERGRFSEDFEGVISI